MRMRMPERADPAETPTDVPELGEHGRPYSVKVYDDSMAPAFVVGDMLIVESLGHHPNPTEIIEVGQAVHVVREDPFGTRSTFLARFQRTPDWVILKKDNANVQNVACKASEIKEIGIVVECRTRRGLKAD